MKRLFVIKIGGNVLDHGPSLQQFLEDFSSIPGPKLLIHGGGKIATKIGERLGIESNYVNGRRITDGPTLDLVTMVYGGLVNKQLVASLQSMGCNALGATGADGNLIQAVKRPVKDIDYGYVGDIKPEGVNTTLLTSLLQLDIVPVFAPLTHSDGAMLNTNADTIASALAIAMSRHMDVRLIYCFEKKGVLKNVADEHSVVHHITEKLYNEMLSNQSLSDGILPKLENAYASIRQGVKEVLIGHAGDLLKNITPTTEGTLITL